MTTPGMFLSAAELADLTDARVRALQMEWLDRNRWIYTTSRMGNPKVLRAYAEQRLGMQAAHQGEAEPDFSAWSAA